MIKDFSEMDTIDPGRFESERHMLLGFFITALSLKQEIELIKKAMKRYQLQPDLFHEAFVEPKLKEVELTDMVDEDWFPEVIDLAVAYSKQIKE